ncbi:MAG: hypothetical protein ACLFR8_00060 [Alkalispirochaeta sp.]
MTRYSTVGTAVSRRRRIAVLVLLMSFGVTAAVTAQFDDALVQVDDLIDDERPDEAIRELSSLEGDARDGAQRGEVYWRLSSATLMRGDQAEDAGASEEELLAIYEEGERYGKRAIEADPSNPLGHYWTSANVGRWGQTKGVLNSLFRAPEMRDLLIETISLDPDHAESYYVLGQLYAKVPGVVSFGNVEWAVSLGRKSVELLESEVDRGIREETSEAFYVQLASHLISRDWNERKRRRALNGIADDYRSASTPVERGYYYEGSVSVPDVADKEEAKDILDGVIRRLEGIRSPSPSERRNLEEARELRAGL